MGLKRRQHERALLLDARPNARVDYVAVRLAAVQGAIWFLLLSHGGKGLIFGPIAWIAMLIAARTPPIAAGLLLAPTVWLVASWRPILDEGARHFDWLVFSSLVGPAVGAAALLLVPGLPRATQLRRHATYERGRM